MMVMKIDKRRSKDNNQSADIRNRVFDSYSRRAEVLRRRQNGLNEQLLVGCPVLLDLPTDDLIALSVLILFQHDTTKPYTHQLVSLVDHSPTPEGRIQLLRGPDPAAGRGLCISDLHLWNLD